MEMLFSRHIDEGKVIMLSPEIAQHLLDEHEESGGGQRTIKPQIVAKYAQDMSDGNWKSCNSVITVSRNPIKRRWAIINGRHRCKAVVESKTTQAFFYFEAPWKEYTSYSDTCDDHATRSAADLAVIRRPDGMTNAPALTVLAAKMIFLEKGWVKATKQEKADYAAKHETALRQSIQFANAFKKEDIFSEKYVSAWHRHISNVIGDCGLVEEWLGEVYTAAKGAQTTISAKTFADWLTHPNQKLFRKNGDGLMMQTLIVVGVKAWNAWISERKGGPSYLVIPSAQDLRLKASTKDTVVPEIEMP